MDVDAKARAMRETAAARRTGGLVIDRQWLGLVLEEAQLPAQSIIDPHHHLWLEDPIRYTFEDYLMDAGSGHTVDATVYAEGYSEYLTSGPAHLRPVGEVQFAVEQSNQGRSSGSAVQLCAGIIGRVDLGPPQLTDEALGAQLDVGEGRLRAVRPEMFSVQPGDRDSIPPLGDKRWDRWADTVQSNGLLVEAWVSYLQLPDLAQLAKRHPGLGLVVNHLGGPVGAGQDPLGSSDMRTAWLGGMAVLSKCHNVVVKVGGLGTSVFGFRLWAAPRPPTSTALAAMWRPWIEPVIDLFGPSRCMFESNYPVDARVGSFNVVWNCFKILAEPHSAEDRDWLCRRTAAQTYRLDRASAG